MGSVDVSYFFPFTFHCQAYVPYVPALRNKMIELHNPPCPCAADLTTTNDHQSKLETGRTENFWNVWSLINIQNNYYRISGFVNFSTSSIMNDINFADNCYQIVVGDIPKRISYQRIQDGKRFLLWEITSTPLFADVRAELYVFPSVKNRF